MLNNQESAYFNFILADQRGDFDFTGKKIGFASGSFGKAVITKKEYFEHWGYSYYKKNWNVANQLVILTRIEKENSGDFDAIVVSWSKVKIDGPPKLKLIKRLKAQRL